MKRLSEFIVKKRNIILVIAVLLLIPSAIGYARTKVNYDLLSYLPSDAESMIAQTSLSDDFELASTGMLVVEHMPDKNVAKLKEEIKQIDGVKDVLWRGDVIDLSIPKEILPKDVKEMLYSKESTLMVITFQEDTASQRTMDAIQKIKGYADKECYLGGFSAITEDTKDLMNQETPLYAITAIGLCVIVLFMGLESTIAPFVFVLGMIFPIAYNFGTNFFLGEISYITKALALVLQLGVTMDYSIFLLHRFQEEKNKCSHREEAMSNAIQATFSSITSSSITTIAGFLALCGMQLTLGKDIGIVMAKGVIFGVLSTIIILPSLLMRFDRYIVKWHHPILLKEPKMLPSFLTKHYKSIPIVFLLIFIPMSYAQAHTNVYYDLNSTMPQSFPSVIGTNKLKDQFHMTTTHFLLVDESLKNYQIKDICDQVEQLDGVYSVVSYESIIGGGIPEQLEPKAIKNILQNGGKKMILVNSTFQSATDEENEQLNKIDDIMHQYDQTAVIAGEGSLTRDLITTTDIDFKMVNMLSVAAIFIIIAITFRSLFLPIVLVASIEFAICINMGIPYFTGSTLPFIASIVIGTIQLGATVDYAILMTTRYKEELLLGNNVVNAAKEAATKSAPSIITSGLSFFAACIGVSFISKMDLIKSLCMLISRGAIISMLVILLVLPALLIVCHKLIEKTTKDWPKADLK
ncbi:efflux RND transporter permease subunit [[Eubacterium] hominis]|uniref:efflux RND transporter permease subunit n=1 Tax=[Eubacterium] hominis TaxID=2764325 RepID=UPI003A4E6163